MISLIISTFFAGIFYLLAGVFGLTRHFLLEPKIADMPKTPRWPMLVFFAFSVVMVYAGMRYLTSWATWQATTMPLAATGFGVMLAFAIFVIFAIFAYKGSLLYDTTTRRASSTLNELIDRLRKL